ncbi:MAG: transglutaminase-like domain-containing protein [Candidatus Thermoplasmatota archaeon]
MLTTNIRYKTQDAKSTKTGYSLVIPIILSTLILATNPFSYSHTIPALSDSSKELYLLRSEHYLYITSSENTSSVSLSFAYPPVYSYQSPIFFELYNDTTAPVQSYKIINDTYPNLLVNFNIGPLHKNDMFLIHFSFYVLIKNHEFNDIPLYVKFPVMKDIPDDALPWLKNSSVVQVNNPLINMKAKQIRSKNNNLISYAKDVAYFIKHNRYPLFVLQLKTGLFFSQDAVTTLLINGENVGRSHLACALFRNQGIPARVVLAHNDQGFWTQMHYMVEYYIPRYGWVLLDSTKGETPYPTRRQIINRICSINDEENTKYDYIHKFMKGEERWLWINTSCVRPYYLDCREGSSRSQMFTEQTIISNPDDVEFAFQLTKQVFRRYQMYLGMNLTPVNQMIFNHALTLQRESLDNLILNGNLDLYIKGLIDAYNEYNQITI